MVYRAQLSNNRANALPCPPLATPMGTSSSSTISQAASKKLA